MFVMGFTLLAAIIAAYMVGWNRGLAEGMTRGATEVEKMRERAMQLLKRCRVKYDVDELDGDAVDDPPVQR